MAFVYEYLVFLAKVVTLLLAVVLLLSLVLGARGRGRGEARGELEVINFNEHLEDLQDTLEHEVLDKDELKRKHKQLAKQEKTAKKQAKAKTQASTGTARVFVMDFDGDIKASESDNLREMITAALTIATAQDEIVLRLESAGGMVHSYGLAASQLARIKQAGVPLTICVDKVAASGGYMMACIGDRILSAPFAILGSIGVVAQVPNIHRLLKKHDVDVELLTAGKYKRTLTMLGENTEEGRQKFVEELEVTHQLFKRFVSDYRPSLDIEQIATGETWLGLDAKPLNLVDEVMTSEEYLVTQAKEKSVYLLRFTRKQKLAQKLGVAAGSVFDTLWSKLLKLNQEQRSGQ